KNSYTLNLTSQPSGIYFCNIISNKKSKTIKLIKQ
ncbi:MAG TPA: hypothetical protein DEG69_00410, partial [Flavobacteriaceae bacterium]|nr:hypothetical protein [Flavobacteriaceae bacterium]